MSLDLGELRASVVIDQGQVPRGLAQVRRKWQDFTRGMTSDAKRAGGDAGGALGSGMATSAPRGLTAVQRRVEAFWSRISGSGDKAGELAGKRAAAGITRGADGKLRDAKGRFLAAGHELGDNVSRGLLGRVRKGVGGLGKVIGGAGSMLGTVALGGAGVLAGLGAAGVAALGAVGVAGAIAGTKVASGNEQAAISFETMLGSATKADRFLRDLQKFAAETPFEFPELQSAASSLISAGINADKVIPIMRTLGDVTSGMGTGSEGVKRATIALQQMSAAGRITGEDLNQLRDAGIPVFDLLAKATGKSKAEVVQLAQAGKLGKKELDAMMKALESGKGLERFSGLMEKQSHSLSGMWSTLKDTLGQGLAGIMSNALPLLKDGLNGITTVATGFFGWFSKNQESISTFFTVGGRSARVFGRIIAGVFQAFIGSTGDGTDAVKNMAQWLEENQETIVSTFVNGGKGALGFAKTLATMAAAGLRAFAFLLDGSAESTSLILGNFRAMAHAAALAFGWVPGVGDKLRAADEAMGRFQENTRAGMHKAASGARGLADGIEKNIIPAIDRGAEAMDKMGKKEIVKARQRDLVAKTARAIRELGTDADGSQLKLKKWKDRTDLSADAQAGLKKRLDSARKGLRDQLGAMADAGAGQGKLTKAWEKGKDRLYAEFKQMGLSNKEAKKLAERYAGVKPKVKTEFTAPGLKDASSSTKTYVDRQGKVKKNLDTDVDVHFGATGKVGLKGQKGKMLYSAYADGGIMPGYTPGRDVHRFVSSTGGVLDLSGGEPVLRPELGTVLGKGWVDGANRAARSGGVQGARRWLAGAGAERIGLATGGTIPSFDRINTAHTRVAKPAGATVAEEAASRLAAAAQAQLKKWEAELGPAPGTGSGKHVRWKGGTFSERFRNTLIAAEKRAGRSIPVTQGGFRPKTSYSGTSHAGDAIDTIWSPRILSALRWAGVYAWHRSPSQGPWPHHIHGIPKKGHGYPGGSGKWQQADAARGGNGLWTGGIIDLSRVAQFDTGGRLRPGWTLAYNGTNKDETVRTHEQEKQLGGRRALIGGNVILQTSDRARDAVGELEFALARIENGGPHE